MELFILAGGLGTRLRKVVNDVPKPMAIVNGKPFLTHILRYWKKNGISAFIISVGYLAEIIESQYGSTFEGCSIRYIHEKYPLGTGGAFLKFLKETKPVSHFLMVNGDTFFDIDLHSLKKYHNVSNSLLTICAFQSTDTVRYTSISYNADGRITYFGKKNNNEKKIVCNGGVYMISPLVFNYLESYGNHQCSFEGDLINFLISKSGDLFVKFFDSPFLDIGLPNDYKRANDFLKRRGI
jgi:D-glycero-alpha-D-manno-heptose 1-phosphate guanylyltransferase